MNKNINRRLKAQNIQGGEVVPDAAAGIKINLKPETVEWCRAMVQDNAGDVHSIILKCVRYSDGAEVIATAGVNPLTGLDRELGVFTVERAITEAQSVAMLNAMRQAMWVEADIIKHRLFGDQEEEANRKWFGGEKK